MATLTDQQLVTSLYVSVFGRAPDTNGLAYWKAQMDSGVSLDAVISGFLGSAEAVSLIGQNASDPVFLNNLYSNVLSRAPDTGGAQYWQGRLDSLKDRGALVKEFISSVNTGTGSDTKLLQNKIEIGENFAASLSGNNTIYAKSMMTYVTSETSALASAQSLNDYFDNGPAAALPTIDFYGHDVKTDFFYPSPFFLAETKTVGAGVEFQGFQQGLFDIDISHTSIKISALPIAQFDNGAYLKFSDVGNALPAFTGVSIISNNLQTTSGAFTPSRISVSDDVVTIDLSGLIINSSSVLEFGVLI